MGWQAAALVSSSLAAPLAAGIPGLCLFIAILGSLHAQRGVAAAVVSGCSASKRRTQHDAWRRAPGMVEGIISGIASFVLVATTAALAIAHIVASAQVSHVDSANDWLLWGVRDVETTRGALTLAVSIVACVAAIASVAASYRVHPSNTRTR
ncbi:hypothetical protein EON66_11335 [archaeon]|nr:MAG: hypothetical protein EON66_11335 [archaeon]